MSKYLGLFVSEATEHLEALGRDLVLLEQAPAQAPIDSMFRHAHSVKGMAASMGFESVATLAHRVEDVVDAVRSDLSRLDRELVDLLLASSDALMGQVQEVREGRPPGDVPELIQQLGMRLVALAGRAPAPTRVAAVNALVPAGAVASAVQAVRTTTEAPEAAPKLTAEPGVDALVGTRRLALQLQVAPTCQVPGVRAFLVHKRLAALGQVVALRPPLEDLKAGRIPEGRFSAELETSSDEETVRQALAKVPEVELTSFGPVKAQAPAGQVGPGPGGASAAGGAVAEAAAVPPEAVRTVRVRTELLDYFLDTVGELLLATARLREVGKAVPEAVRAPLDEGVDRLHGLVKDLHDKVMGARMTPVSVVTERLPRAARDLARRTGREVQLQLAGTEVELDRAILDELGDPLLHLLRNCIDHGLESPEERTAAGKPREGRVSLSVKRLRDRVVLELEDDGRGMDPERLKAAAVERGAIPAEAASRLTEAEALLLCCLPGVSTARDVSDISGRGVGMDAVKRVVEGLGGTLEITSQRGRGTRFTLRLPLTVAVVQLLLVGVGEEIYGLPVAKVLGAVEADLAQLTTSRERPLLPHGAGLLPVHRLSELLEVPERPATGARPFVVMEGDAGKIAIAVERLLGQEEVVLKPLSRPLDLVPGLSGSTILGSGRPIFILDVPRLL